MYKQMVTNLKQVIVLGHQTESSIAFKVIFDFYNISAQHTHTEIYTIHHKYTPHHTHTFTIHHTQYIFYTHTLLKQTTYARFTVGSAQF